MKKIAVALFTSSIVTLAIAATTTLSPNENNQSGVIPAGFDDLTFSVEDGNWVKNISLPQTAKEGALLTIRSTATYTSFIDLSNVNINKSSNTTWALTTGNSYSFQFHQGKWDFYTPTATSFTPAQNGKNIPAFSTSQAQYLITENNWANDITLPEGKKNDQILIIKSTALKASSINPQKLLFASTYKLNQNDSYIFKYNLKLKKWLPLSMPKRIINVENGNITALNNRLQQLSSPITEVRFADGSWVSSLNLPATANDRDRIVVTSSATWQATINNKNTNTEATMKLNSGDRYEFIYIADKAYWALVSSPKTQLTAKAAATGFRIKAPIVEIKAKNGDWAPVINLPTAAQSGDKVIVSSTAYWGFKVNANNLSDTITQGSKTRYVFKNGQWTRDSSQIDLLLVTSPSVSRKFGATAIKVYAREALRLTNEGLENSQAKAYFREVGYLDYRIPGTTLGDALNYGRSNTTVQNERTRLGADGVYVISDQEGYGLAFVNGSPNKYNMIGSENYAGDLFIMRHELGHNLGLGHAGDRTTGYGWGFDSPLARTIMGGNSLGLYSGPDIYTLDGVRIGKADERDSVRKINDNAESISNFFVAVK